MAITITGDNEWTDAKFFSSRFFTVTISGTFDAIVTVQRVNQNDEPTGASEWKNVKSYTIESEENGLDSGGHWYRIGVKTGDFTSGSIDVDIY